MRDPSNSTQQPDWDLFTDSLEFAFGQCGRSKTIAPPAPECFFFFLRPPILMNHSRKAIPRIQILPAQIEIRRIAPEP